MQKTRPGKTFWRRLMKSLKFQKRWFTTISVKKKTAEKIRKLAVANNLNVYEMIDKLLEDINK